MTNYEIKHKIEELFDLLVHQEGIDEIVQLHYSISSATAHVVNNYRRKTETKLASWKMYGKEIL